MTYVTTLDSTIRVSDTNSTHNIEFRLPISELRGISPLQTPNTSSRLVAANEVWDLDLTSLGTKFRVLAVKATRPCQVTLVTPTDTIVYPYSTYLKVVLDTTEALTSFVERLSIRNAPEPGTAPTQRPPRYPSSLIEVFILMEDNPTP